MSSFPQIQARVFKYFLGEEKEEKGYEVRTGEDGLVSYCESHFFQSLKKAAEFVGELISDNITHFESFEGSAWRNPETIVFAPKWDIICSERNKKIAPRYCIALTNYERAIFWEHFVRVF